jgi:hypothetical protein
MTLLTIIRISCHQILFRAALDSSKGIVTFLNNLTSNNLTKKTQIFLFNPLHENKNRRLCNTSAKYTFCNQCCFSMFQIMTLILWWRHRHKEPSEVVHTPSHCKHTDIHSLQVFFWDELHNLRLVSSTTYFQVCICLAHVIRKGEVRGRHVLDQT